ncbi:MAG: hypothetical protein ACJ74M_04675 [Gaiellaceae bacterium]|jgi:hypothetical protein
MPLNSSLDELVIFELPNRELAVELLSDLASKRFAWMQSGDHVAVVAALLNPDRLDLARLLRGVQSWLAWRGVVAIRFEIDGKMYVVDAVSRPLVPA